MAYKKIEERTEKEWAAYKYWASKPVEAVKDWFGVTPDDWQGDALEAIFNGNENRVIAKSAHGVGKTALDAWIAWIFVNCYKDSRVVATAPVQAQLTDVLFPEIGLWHSKMNARMRSEWLISAQHVRQKTNPNVWFMVARTSNKPANLQGFHNANIQIIGDEGSGIPEVVFEVMEGALSEAGDEGKIARLILTGNPNFTSGEMFNAFGKNKKLYHRITVTGDKSLLTELGIEQGGYHEQHGRVYYTKRVKEKYRATMEAKYGKDSAIYDVRVRACFPRFSDDCVIAYEHAARAMQMEMPKWDAVAHPVTLVVDPARGGFAETVIGYFRGGVCYKLMPFKISNTSETVKQIHLAVMDVISGGLTLKEIIIDEPGIGGPIIDRVLALNLPARPYNGSLPMVKEVDPEEDCRLFQNKRARDYWSVRMKLEHGTLPLPYDEVLLAQGTSIKYGYNKMTEKIQIESKQDLKDRLGPDASPDRFDVIVMGTADTFEAGVVQNQSLDRSDWAAGDARPKMDDDL